MSLKLVSLKLEDLIRRLQCGDLKPNVSYSLSDGDDPVAKSFPDAILKLRPSYVFATEDGVIQVEMCGGMDHFGVRVYPSGYQRKSYEAEPGDKELVPGLWYYDDGYRECPDWEKRLEELRPRN